MKINTRKKEDLDLLIKCINNNDCESLIKKYYNFIEQVIIKTCYKKNISIVYDDVEDLRNQTFYELFKDDYRRLKSFDPSRNVKFSSWIRLITANTVFDYLAKKDPHNLSKVGNLVSLDDVFKDLSFENYENRLDARQTIFLLKQCIKNITKAERIVFKLLIFSNLEPKKIAAYLQISTREVYKKKSRALKKIKNCLIKLGILEK